VYKVLVGKPEGKRPLGRPRHRWEDGILGRLAGGGVECIHLAQRIVNMAMNLRFLAPRSYVSFDSLAEIPVR
jgi:hypothetical protein